MRADGHRQILRITPYIAEQSLYKPKYRSTGALSRSDTIASSSEGFEAVMEDVSPTLTFSVEFAGIGISLVNRRMIEVVYISIEALTFEYSNSPVSQSVNLSCGSLQVDNQLHDALYPVILQPSPISKEASGVAVLPTIQGSVIWLKDKGQQSFLLSRMCTQCKFRTRCLICQIFLSPPPGADHRGRRRSPFCNIRSDANSRRVMGRRH